MLAFQTFEAEYILHCLYMYKLSFKSTDVGFICYFITKVPSPQKEENRLRELDNVARKVMD